MPKEAQISKPPDVTTLNIPSPERPTLIWRVSVFALHPFLFAAASVFRSYASNLRELYFSDVLVALGAALAAALLLLLAFSVVFRSLGAKAAILASAALVVGIFYVEIVDAANRYLGVSLSLVAALPIMLAALAALLVAVAWLRLDFTPANAIFNGIAFMIFIVPAWHVASHSWRAGSHVAAAAIDEMSSAAEVPPAADPATVNNAPRQIFYLIFDRYGSQSVLADYYSFDNSDLANFLEEKGFYVASNSRANYLKTAHSLASTFHMGYLDFLAEEPRSKIGDWHPIYDMLRDHRVGRFLKSRGYNFVQIGSWWGPTQYNPYADENHSFGFSDFNYLYLRRTIVAPILDMVAPDNTFARRLQWDQGQCERVPRQIEKVKEIGSRREKTFVFAHILVPHEPYVFRADGRCLSSESEWSETESYIEQVRYANSLIKDFISALLATDGPKPIIVLQSDEGPFPPRYRSEERSWRDATIDELRAKTGILNAFYFPDGDYRGMDPQVTSVNTFRIVFNKHFGTTLKRLPDRIYAFPDKSQIYDFYEITDVLRDGVD
jgi:hypothetical protein